MCVAVERSRVRHPAGVARSRGPGGSPDRDTGNGSLPAGHGTWPRCWPEADGVMAAVSAGRPTDQSALACISRSPVTR